MTEVYKVGVKLAMTSNHAEILKALASGLLGVQLKTDQLIGSFGKLKLAIGGAFAVFAGREILMGLGAIVEKTKDLSDELVKIQKMGLNKSQLDAAQAQAVATARNVPGITRKDALGIYGSLYSMVGDDEARKMMLPMARYAQVVGQSSGNYERAFADVYKMARSADLIGQFSDPVTKQFDEERFQKFLDVGARLNLATHGQVGPAQLLGLAQQGGPALRGLSESGLYSMGIMAQAMGAQRAGTAMMSLQQQMAGGTMFTRNAEELHKLGLLGGKGKTDKSGNIIGGEWSDNSGRVMINDAASRRLAAIFRDDPLKGVVDTLIPAMEAHGITGVDDQTRELFKLFGRATTQRAIADEMLNFRQMIAERGRISEALGVPAAQGAANDGSVTTNLHNLQAAWDNLLYAVGGPNSANTIFVLKALTSGIKSMTAAVDGMNLKVLEGLAIGIAGLGAAMVGGGTVALLAAIGPAGWIIGGIAALGAAAVTFGPTLLSVIGPNGSLSKGLINLGDALSKYDWSHAFSDLIGGLQSLWGKLKAFLTGGGNGAPYDPSNDPFAAGGFHPMSYTTYGRPAGVGAFHSGGGYTINGGAGAVAALGNPMGSIAGGSGINDAASFDRTFAGTALQGHWGDVVAAANANGIPPNLMAAIMAHETGRGKVLTGNNVAGLMDPATHSMSKLRFGSIGDGINAAAKTIAKNWARAGGDLNRMGSIYAPPGAANDPRGLNGGWASGVRRFLGDPSGSGRANFMHGQFGGIGQNLTDVTTAGGHKMRVNAAAAPYIRGFVEDLERAGAPINSIGGFNPRHIAGSSRWSQHAYGNAIDIDQHSRNVVDRNFAAWAAGHQAELRGALQRWGIINGGDWKNPDFGHFEWSGRGGDSPAVPSASGKDITVHHTTMLDGRVLTKSTMKHMVKMGNGPAQGARLPDYTATRPLSI